MINYRLTYINLINIIILQKQPLFEEDMAIWHIMHVCFLLISNAAAESNKSMVNLIYDKEVFVSMVRLMQIHRLY